MSNCAAPPGAGRQRSRATQITALCVLVGECVGSLLVGSCRRDSESEPDAANIGVAELRAAERAIPFRNWPSWVYGSPMPENAADLLYGEWSAVNPEENGVQRFVFHDNGRLESHHEDGFSHSDAYAFWTSKHTGKTLLLIAPWDSPTRGSAPPDPDDVAILHDVEVYREGEAWLMKGRRGPDERYVVFRKAEMGERGDGRAAVGD